VGHGDEGPGGWAWFALLPGREAQAQLDEIEALTGHLALAGGLDADAAFFLGVALREAVTNALRHGRGRESSTEVSVAVGIDGDRLVAIVRDLGPGFDPSAVPDPLAPENLTRPSGRGLFFMRRFADRVVFSRPRRGGVRVWLEKRLPHPPGIAGIRPHRRIATSGPARSGAGESRT